MQPIVGRVSALFVQTDGAYFGLPHVDPWDESRDARKYAGPNPVVAHPPCQRWGKMWAGSPSVIARTGVRKVKGDDGGCFEAALDAVRLWGGILEHPWGSHAWPHFGLAVPPRTGGWIAADKWGWTCCVEQGRYGHYAPKPTLLYAVGTELPDLKWGKYAVCDDDFPEWAMKRYGRKKCRRIGLLSFKGGGQNSTPRIHTPDEFRDLLVRIACTANAGGEFRRDSGVNSTALLGVSSSEKRRIKQNAWGNWYGYEGSKRVKSFAETPEYSMEQNAERWRDGIE